MNIDYSQPTVTFEATASAEPSLTPRIDVLFYDLAGPFVECELYATAEVTLNSTLDTSVSATLDISIKVGMDVNAGVTFNDLLKDLLGLDDWSWQLLSIVFDEWDWEYSTNVQAGITASMGGSVGYSYPGGSGSVSPTQTTNLSVDSGTQISLTASPNSGFVFEGWSAAGSVSVSDPNAASTTITVNGNGGATANFANSVSNVTVPGAVESGLGWLQSNQNPDGSWSYGGTENVGITGLCALAFLNNGVLDSSVGKALDWVVSQRQVDGSLYSGAVSREEEKVYDTSMGILALIAGKSLGYTPPEGANLNTVIGNGVAFLLQCQCVGISLDGYTYSYSNSNYGGWGYPRYDWADLSNTQWALLALAAAKTAGVSNVPLSVWENAAVFVIRCLNDPKYNPNWYSSTDGGFSYQPSETSYESMVAAGVWSLGLCKSAGVRSVTVDGVDVSLDRAISDGVNWLQNYASVTQNYGDGLYFYYYSLLSVAKAYLIVGQGSAWYQSMVSQLESSQLSDGHWPEVYSEEPDTMATAEAILAFQTQTPPAELPTELHVILGSYSSLYITDPYGRHIGIDPNTGQVVNEIPNATFSTDFEQNVSILDPLAGIYNISIYGTGTGPYNLTIGGEVNGTVSSSQSILGTVEKGVVEEWTTAVTYIGELTVIITPPSDNIPPITNLEISKPEYVDPLSNVTYVTQYTPFTLEAYDPFSLEPYDNESNIAYTVYQILNSTYESGWQNFTTPFILDPMKDGNYTIEFYSVDNAGNVETINSANVTLHWLYGDINHDGQVNLLDLTLLAESWRSTPNDPNWNQNADLAAPWGIISLSDLVTVAVYYHHTFHP